MLRSCVCLRTDDDGKRRSSSVEDASSCRSSEIERVGASMQTLGPNGQPQSSAAQTSTRASSLLQLFQRRGWCKHFRKPLRGMSASRAEKTIRAAIFIQKWYRRHQARREMQRRCNWQIFQNLEYASEQDQAELYKFFNDLIKHMPQAAGRKNQYQGSAHVSVLDDKDDLVEEFGDIVNAKIELPIRKNHIDLLIDVFRKKRGNRLHPKYVALILREAAKSLKQLPNISPVSTAVSQQVTVCGDLHGKLDDLLVVLHKNGLPSSSNPYVFNGDFVDRGKRGLEVLLLLLSLYLAFPNAVFLNRGNHEDSVMNARYGFIREVESKYPRNHKRILAFIDEVYRWLPLGSVLNSRVLIVHGGFSDSTSLDLIKSIDRGKYVSILRPPLTDGEPLDKTEWQQIFDIMWSDPQATMGCVPNTLRGAGVWFGPDVTDNFLQRHRLSYVIRSHECKPNGHEFMHDNKIITIFSASNYYAIGSNKGAYIRLNNQLMPHFVQYISAASQTKRLSFKQRMGIVESSALKELAVRMRDHRDELEDEFRKYDPKDSGYISISHWCKVMENVTKLGLPWRLLRDKLAPGTDSQKVNYNRTLDLLDTDVILEAEADGMSVMDALYANKASLVAIFNIIDADNSGEITLDEFETAIDLLVAHMPGAYSKAEMLEKCRMMDLNGDGKVDLNEFLEAFRLSDLHRKEQQDENIRRRSTGRPSVAKTATDPVTLLADKISKNTLVVEHDIDPTDCESKVIDPKKSQCRKKTEIFIPPVFYSPNCSFMERLHYPIPLNPNAKYLPNSISNVLYSIQKFDQSTLAWPTCQRKTNVSIGKAFTSPPEVPFAGTATCVIQKGRQCASRCTAKEVQKNTFYQILQASQDQPRIQQSSRIKRKSIDPKFKCDFKDDSIYNDIYDIVRSHTQYKKLPQIEKQPEQQKPISLNPPAVEVYKVRPFANEIKEPRSKTPKSNAKGNKLREKTNELSDSKRTTHQSKLKLGESKSSRKHTFKLREKTNELLGSKRTTHHSKPKLAESKSSRKNTNKLREKANELSDSKRTTHHSKPKLAESKSSRKNRNKLQEKTNEITDSRRTSTSISLQNQLLKFQTRENKQKRNSKSEKHKTTQQLWPLRDKGAVRIPQRSIYNEQSNVGSEIKSNFSTTQLPDPDGQKVQEVSTEEQGNLEEKPEQETERASDIKRNSNEESGRRRRKSKLKLKLFNAYNNNTIYVVQARNSKGFTRESLSNKRSGKEIYKIQEMKLNPFKEQEEISTLNPQKSDSYILGRSKTRINPNRTRESRASKKISTIREKSLVENISDITIPNNLQTNLKSMSVKPKEQEVNGITAPVKEEIVSKPRKVYPLNSILNVGNISKTISNPGDQNEKMVQISSQKNKPKDSFEENTAHTTQSTTDKLKSKTKTTSNVSQKKDKSRFFRHKLQPPTPTNSFETEIEALPVYPYEEHDNEDETSYISESFYLSDRRTVERKSILDRLNLKIRKTNLDMTPEMYQERLIKVKQFLSRHSITENTDTSSIDIEGILYSDLLMYPYSEIYENRTTVTKVNQPNVSEAIKEDSKPIPRPPDDTRKIQNEKPVCNKTACIICRTIRGNHGTKEAPFMEQMRRENRRRELLAYRAKIEEPRLKSFNILPKDPMNEAKAINLHDLSKKELYTLKSRSSIYRHCE